jgi:hypothetical protein
MTQTAPKQPKTPAPGTVAERVRQTVDRLNLDEGQAAAYFGVPVYTVRKWCTGEREPGAAVARLLDVLGLVEALAPALHGSFLPPVSTTPRRKPGRVKKLAPEIGHVEKSGLHESTVSLDNSVMSENPV